MIEYQKNRYCGFLFANLMRLVIFFCYHYIAKFCVVFVAEFAF